MLACMHSQRMLAGVGERVCRQKERRGRGAHLLLGPHSAEVVLVAERDALDFLAYFVEREDARAERHVHYSFI